MIEIKPVNKKNWESFLESQKPHSFLHSWNWGEFNKALNYKIFRLGIYDKDELKGLALILKIKARRGSFLFIPHGPILENYDNFHELFHLFAFLRRLARREKCSFVRVSPLMLNTPENKEALKDLGFRKAPIHMHSELNWILDTTKSEAELLKDMRKTTRYSINKAEKDGVEIIKSDRLEDVKVFNEIYQATVNRQHFTPFSLSYLESEFESFRKDGKALLFFGKYNGEIISAAMIIFSNGGAYYHQGASLLKYPKITASYLLQWEIIKETRRRGLEFYNFWGVAPEGKSNHPWAGLSLFKKGFGGFPEEYLPAQDLRLDGKYWLSFLIEKSRKIKRRL